MLAALRSASRSWNYCWMSRETRLFNLRYRPFWEGRQGFLPLRFCGWMCWRANWFDVWLHTIMDMPWIGYRRESALGIAYENTWNTRHDRP